MIAFSSTYEVNYKYIRNNARKIEKGGGKLRRIRGIEKNRNAKRPGDHAKTGMDNMLYEMSLQIFFPALHLSLSPLPHTVVVFLLPPSSFPPAVHNHTKIMH